MAPTREKFLALTFLTVLFFALSAIKARAADPNTKIQAPMTSAGTCASIQDQ
ncbi:MAG: hypothetical protein MUF06_09040 [Pirellulaceae bacterium]|nr:hypothetical protein [Pirellulaceae bacterium]